MRVLYAFVIGLAWASAVSAQGTAADPAAQPPAPDQPITFEDQVVVSASRAEEQLIDAPATMTVVTPQAIQNAPSVTIGDLLRAVPGMNVTQVSARDVNITTRRATSTLSTSQLALVDGRSVYLDFFGMVMWDLVPANPTRDQADRSRSRSGVGRVGRERDDGRRQRDHANAARAGA